MLGLGPFAVFIIAAYSIPAITLLALTTWVVLSEKRQRSELEKLGASNSQNPTG